MTKYFKGAAASLLLFSMAGITPAAVSAEEASKDFSMTVFHLNDSHGHLENASKIATLLKKQREEAPHHVLLHGGDAFTGTLYFNEFDGQADLEFFNHIGMDAMVFGNHEFDRGHPEDGHQDLAAFVKNAKFPMLGTNVDFSKDPNFEGMQFMELSEDPEDGKIYKGIVKEVNGEKIGIFGLTTEDTIDISSPESVVLTNYITEAKEAVKGFEEMGINKIIAVNHVGYHANPAVDSDLKLALEVPEIDIIVGGHSHTALQEPIVVNEDKEPTIIVQAGEHLKFLGQLDVTFDENGVIKEYNGVLHASNAEGLKNDPEVDELLAPYDKKIEEVQSTLTGGSAGVFLSGLRGLGGVRAGETNLGNLITDGMLAKAQEIDPDIKIAFQNGGGIRTSIEKGDITFGEVLTVLPFGNSLAIMELSGEELYETFEHSVSKYPSENGGFLHVSGMKVVFDPAKEAGSRIASLTIGDEKVEKGKMYKVATNVFTAKGGDGFKALEKAYDDGRITEPGFSDWENLANHIKSLGVVTIGLEDRIIAKVPYTDVSMNSYAYPYISDLYYRDVLSKDGKFHPGKDITRAEMVTWISKAMGLKAEGVSKFTDLDGLSDEVKSHIAAAEQHGIVKGTDGKFNPNDKVTRAQFALILQRAFEDYSGQPYKAKEKAPYSDFGKYADDAVNAISMLHELGIATGYQGKYMPEQFTTRQQAAKIVSNFLYNTKQVKKAEK